MRGASRGFRGGGNRGGGQREQLGRPLRERSPVQLIRRNREPDGGDVLSPNDNSNQPPRRKIPSLLESPRGNQFQRNNNNNNQQQRGNPRSFPGRSMNRPMKLDEPNRRDNENPFVSNLPRPSILQSPFVQQMGNNNSNPFQVQQQQQQRQQNAPSMLRPWITNQNPFSSNQNQIDAKIIGIPTSTPFQFLHQNNNNNSGERAPNINNRSFNMNTNNNNNPTELIVAPFSSAINNSNRNNNGNTKPLLNEPLIRNPFSEEYAPSNSLIGNQNPDKQMFSKKPPPPPLIGKASAARQNMESQREEEDPILDSYEAKFIDFSATLGLETKSTPTIKMNDFGIKMYSYNVEFSRDKSWGIAEGEPFPSISKAREAAYELAYFKAKEIFSDLLGGSNNNNNAPRQMFDGQKSWPVPRISPPSLLQQDNVQPKLETGFKPKLPSLLDPIPPPPPPPPMRASENRLNPNVVDNNQDRTQVFELKFKNIMDVLQMQCWLENFRSDGKIAFEIKVQSYDKAFQEFYTGEYYHDEHIAKESAFAEACKTLERRFPRELVECTETDVVLPQQRHFLDLRSALGLEFKCTPEVQIDNGNNGTILYAYNIEFSRPDGSTEPESVFGEFSKDRDRAKERSFEQACRRIQYIFSTELENMSYRPGSQLMQRNNELRSGEPPAKRTMFASQQQQQQQTTIMSPSMMSPSLRKKSQSLAFVPPLLKSTPEPLLISRENPMLQQQQQQGQNINSMEQTFEYRFKQQSKLLDIGYSLKKIPKFEGSHKIYAFEINAQGQGGNSSYSKKTMGQFLRDETAAKENSYKYALDELNNYFPNTSGRFY